MRKRYSIGHRAACALCGHDIEYQGRGKWNDRGGGIRCLPHRTDDGETMDPPINQHHKPDPNAE